jgi:hypothetical protein
MFNYTIRLTMKDAARSSRIESATALAQYVARGPVVPLLPMIMILELEGMSIVHNQPFGQANPLLHTL